MLESLLCAKNNGSCFIGVAPWVIKKSVRQAQLLPYRGRTWDIKHLAYGSLQACVLSKTHFSLPLQSILALLSRCYNTKRVEPHKTKTLLCSLGSCRHFKPTTREEQGAAERVQRLHCDCEALGSTLQLHRKKQRLMLSIVFFIITKDAMLVLME